jgi:hypothetical protein
MESEISLSWSREHTSVPYPNPDESCLTFTPYLITIHFNIIPSFATKSPKRLIPFCIFH